MTSSSQLEIWSNDLAIAVKSLSDHCHVNGTASTPHLAITNGAPGEADRARRNILTITTHLQALLAEPVEFIQHLAGKVRRTRTLERARNVLKRCTEPTPRMSELVERVSSACLCPAQWQHRCH